MQNAERGNVAEPVGTGIQTFSEKKKLAGDLCLLLCVLLASVRDEP